MTTLNRSGRRGNVCALAGTAAFSTAENADVLVLAIARIAI
jgi:hypothetical protein